MANHDTKNYLAAGGTDWVVGGNLYFLSGSVIKYNSVDVTALFSDYSTGVVTVGTSLAFAAGASINADSGTLTLSSNAGTLSKMAGVVTSESLTTAAGAIATFVITNTMVAAGDLVFLEVCGGTNTKNFLKVSTATTSNTITIKFKNVEATDPLDGTLKFNFLVVKA